MVDEVFEKEYRRKTPDIVLLKLDSESEEPRLKQLFIGEVKYTEKTGSLKAGLQQLLEYGAHAKFGHQMQRAEGQTGKFIADQADFLTADDIELGFFVGDTSLIKGETPDGINVYGYPDTPERPFKKSNQKTN